jgi:predicted dehydrogenase
LICWRPCALWTFLRHPNKLVGMNRREFTTLSALSLAATRLPAQTSVQTPAKPVGYAAIGLGTISDIFMRACARVPEKAKITALVTGHPVEKGEKYAAMYGIPKSSIYTYETFDKIRDNKDVEAVYVGLPNSMHREFTERGAAAGKHVLCEKPMAISSAECRSMIAACKKANVKLMIAYRVQYEPLWNQMMEMVRSGDIGQVQSCHGGFYGSQRAGAWRLDRKLAGGGSILDLGIYPLNAIRHILAEEPVAFTAVASTREQSTRFAEVEQSVEWTMKFPSGILAMCGSSYGASGPAYLTIQGDRGYLDMRPGFFYDPPHLTGQAGGKSIDIPGTGTAPYQFTNEAIHFSDCIRNNTEPLSPGEEGLKDMIAIEAIYKAAGAPIA